MSLNSRSTLTLTHSEIPPHSKRHRLLNLHLNCFAAHAFLFAIPFHSNPRRNETKQPPKSLEAEEKKESMGSLAEENNRQQSSPAVTEPAASMRRPRLLCLHGFRTSCEIMKKQILGKWPDLVTSRFDLFFADAPFPAEGKSDVDGIFDPPYYEWFQFHKGFEEFRNFDECLKYIEELMIKEGPFDGLMGFSQGAMLSAALPGLQEKGVALTRVPKLKYVVIIGGAKFRARAVVDKAYASKIKCRSLHFIGAMDFLRKHGEELIVEYVDPHVIRHPRGHTVPRLDEKSLDIMLDFLDKIEKDLQGDEVSVDEHRAECVQL